MKSVLNVSWGEEFFNSVIALAFLTKLKLISIISRVFSIVLSIVKPIGVDQNCFLDP